LAFQPEVHDSCCVAYLGAFPVELAGDEVCARPSCRARPQALNVWIINGQVYVLPLCPPCTDKATSAVGARMKRFQSFRKEAKKDARARRTAVQHGL